MNWTLLSGTFTATGGERYLTLGNFTTPFAPDTVFVGATNAPYEFAFYYLDAVELRTCESGIGEDASSALRVFPNPADERVMVEVAEEALGATVTLVDVAGRVVFQQRMNTNTASIDAADLARGCYSLHLTTPTMITTVKLILE
ncbi:MAG: T9SS type A sorting domain-containing protein [Flavobacteriales bacterium]|nr:T9SS type A sorting domain-containing protein [Flavobacteriales bacterium]